jgi:hypothetical protein
MHKVWKTTQASGNLLNLAAALNAIETKMRGTVFSIMPWTEVLEGKIRGRQPMWDIVYFIETW